VLLQEGAPVEAVHVLLDGAVRARRKQEPGDLLTGPAAIGLRETLEGRPSDATVRAEGAIVTLAISSEDIGTLLADNQDLIEGLLRTFAAGGLAPAAAAPPPVVHGGAAPDLLAMAAEGAVPIHRVLVLQRLPLFSQVTSHEMFHAAASARLQHASGGSEIAPQGRQPGIYYVLAGELAAEPGRPVARPGDAFGVYETLAGSPIGRVIRATGPSTVLSIERAELLDLLGQRPALAQQVFASLFQGMQAIVTADGPSRSPRRSEGPEGHPTERPYGVFGPSGSL
jgi:CRP-like cAMP-binding protein